uniref:Uncharacterized protein n=1 Tax=Human herpesvirus 2 TaxID=10310 RepID=A0A481TUE0_HHV2|nr:hypothetical protein [Human alphaherpesvirus 2]QBH85238.1 hypothetical protein [Human alphaherpesvirus 2]
MGIAQLSPMRYQAMVRLYVCFRASSEAPRTIWGASDGACRSTLRQARSSTA